MFRGLKWIVGQEFETESNLFPAVTGFILLTMWPDYTFVANLLFTTDFHTIQTMCISNTFEFAVMSLMRASSM